MRLARMWQRAFDRYFLEFMNQGMTRDRALEMAERYADEGLDRYVDDKLEERKCE